MKNFIENIKDSLHSVFADYIVNILVSFLAAWLADKGLNCISSSYSEIEILIFLVSVFLITYIFSAIFQLKIFKYKFFILSMDGAFEYLGDSVVTYQTLEVRPILKSQNEMYFRRTWFSDEKIEVSTETPGFQTVLSKTTGNQHEYYIKFPQTLHWWQTVKFTIITRGENNHRRVENFYWIDIIAPTKNLSISITIPRDLCKKYAYKKSFVDHENSKNAKCEDVNFNGFYKWTVPNPKLNTSYKFEWQWSKKEQKKINRCQ